MLKELETVVINTDIPEYDLIKGDIGVIVHLYSKGEAAEVEFVSGEGKIVGIVTIPKENIRQIAPDEIFHVRELHAS